MRDTAVFLGPLGGYDLTTDVPKPEMNDGQSRGRPRGNYRLFKGSLKSIVLIAQAHDIEPKQLIDAFVEAWKQNVAYCGGLTIRRRAIDQDSVTFLLTHQKKFISQFPIKQEVLRTPESFQAYIEYVPTPPPALAERARDSVHVGDVVEIENGYVASFAGEPQLRLGRKGTLSTVN